MIILTHSNYVCNRQLVMTYIGNLLFILCQVQFLKRAVDILCQCRQTLMFTYVFAYYLRKNNQSLIFEANQKDLESATETLSEYLERDITSENLADIKQKVQDKYRYNTSDWWFWSKCERHVRAKIIMLFSFIIFIRRYCEKRREVLLLHVHEGYDQEWWVYTDWIKSHTQR